jgi:hypothetical protein
MSGSFRVWMSALAAAFAFVFVADWLRHPTHASAAEPSPADPGTMTFQALCDAYQQGRADALLAELYKRHEVTPEDWQHVITGQIYVGMSRNGLECARGVPDDTRSNTTRYGVTEWYSYRSPRLLVRLDDGKVESFSD